MDGSHDLGAAAEAPSEYDGHVAPLAALKNARAVLSAATVLGMGMGAFADGIVFHQLLQVHNMLSAEVDRRSVVGLEVNMFWDGVFHLVAWATTLAGTLLLWRALVRAPRSLSMRLLWAGLWLGWGAFNVIEGVVDHEILGLHHVIEDARSHALADVAFLASGVALLAAGWWQAARHRIV